MTKGLAPPELAAAADLRSLKPIPMRAVWPWLGVAIVVLGCQRRDAATPPARPVEPSAPFSPALPVIAPGPLPTTPEPPPRAPVVDAPPPPETKRPTSRFGRFELARRADASCVGHFDWATRTSPTLFIVPNCDGDVPGMNTLAATKKIAQMAFPVVAKDGTEFHLFEIATFRGGNARPGGTDYYVVAVRSDRAWSVELPSGDPSLASFQAEAGSLVLEEPPTTTTEGARHTIVFGRLTSQVLPVVPSHIVQKERLVVTGVLHGGYGYTQWHPILNPDTEPLIIDDRGRCRLPYVGEQLDEVTLTIEVTTWSDQRTEVRCVSTP